MKLTMVFRHLESSDPAKQHVEEKIEKLRRFFSKEPVKIHVVLSQIKFRFETEIVVSADHLSFTCIGEGDDLYSSIDQAYHKVESQLRRHKERAKDHKATRPLAVETAGLGVEP